VIPIDKLVPYFKIAEGIAKQSECIRRKYGVVVAYEGPDIRYQSGYNQREAQCCNGNICIRDRMRVMNGERTEVGAEVHAEITALINAGPKDEDSYFILVGYDKHGNELFGKSVYPCHACALALKFAGYKNIYIRTEPDEIHPVSVARILEEREEEWSTTATI
jgi:deoxycytidylate deaminase